MQTVLLVSPMTLGDEVPVREIHERFPVEALFRGVGVERLIAFIGSGLYALEITVGDGDFQERFHEFLLAPEIQALFQELRPYVEDLPYPDQQTADMPMAAAMLVWESRGRRDSTHV
jgi:hypothetical protein